MERREKKKFRMEKYLDKMRESLNKNIDKHVASSWRAHNSLKGWWSMNYPSTLWNPMLKRRPNHQNPESIKFSNLNRPISAPKYKVKRPFTAITAKGKRVGNPLPITHNYYNATKAELLLLSESENEESATESIKLPVQMNEYSNNAYDLTKYHSPFAIQKNVTAYKLSHEPLPSIDSGADTAVTTLGNDYAKKSSGMLTTTNYQERVNVLNILSQKSQYISPLKPIAAYLGKKPQQSKDPYDRRKVKQLDDISFESDDEPEEVKNLRRLPSHILTEENLKESLSKDLKSLNLNSHFWLKNNFIDKIGRMAPNLVELWIRNLKVTPEAFSDLVKPMGLLKIIDISNCSELDEKSIIALAESNNCIVNFKASGWANAITDASLSSLVENSKVSFEILDLSFWTNLTDEGLSSFEKANPNQAFRELYLSGIIKVTNVGFSSLLSTWTKSLIMLNMSLNNQYELTGEVCKAIGKCFELQILDLTGWSSIGDDGINNLAAGSIQVEDKIVIVGLK